MRVFPIIKTALAVCCAAVIALAGCKKAIEEAPKMPVDTPADTTATIMSFKITAPLEAAGIIDRQSITVVVPPGTDITKLRAEAALSSAGEIKPDPGDALDYSGPRRFTVTSENGSVLDYTITARAAEADDCAISLFRINSADGIINHEARTIMVTLPYGTGLSYLVPTILHTGQDITPSSGLAQDFRYEPVEYTVTARDQSTRSYKASVRIALNPAKEITAFRVTYPAEVTGIIDEEAKRVNVSLPFGSELSAVTAELEHTGSAARPHLADPWDYSYPQTVTITAADGTEAEYTIVMRVDADIEHFTLTSPVTVPGAIDYTRRIISVSVPYITDLSAVQAAASASGGQITPDPSQARNYAETVSFTLEAEGQADRTYTVDVTKMPPGNYTVVYDPNGTTSGFMHQSSFAYNTDNTLPENTYTRSGYTFAGWSAREDGQGTRYLDKAPARNLAPPDGSVTLYAQWAGNAYTVAYDGNKPANTTLSGSTSATTHTYDTPSPLAANGFSVTGYAFDGWNTKQDGSGASYSADEQVSVLAVSGTVTLYAKWKAHTYTVAYDSNAPAGTTAAGSTSPATHTYDKDAAIAANGFSVPHYTFTGWNAQKTGGGASTAYQAGQTVKNLSAAQGATVTLYAQWDQTVYAVTFASNGGSAVAAATVVSGQKAVKPADPTRTGMSFGGWYTESALTTAYDWNAAASADLTLYARWTNTITFNVNSGSAVEALTVTTGTAAAKPADPSKANVSFGGWYKESALTTAYDWTAAVSANITLYAHWTNTITFNANSGSAVAPLAVTSGAAAAKPADPARSGYTFMGWYKEAALTTAYTWTAAVSANITLYAKWSTAYTVTYQLNYSGAGEYKATNAPGIVTTPATAATLPAAPARSGWNFQAWNNKADGTGTAFTGSSVTANVTVYATWTLKPTSTTASTGNDGGSEQVFTVPEAGVYRIELWGSQGGAAKQYTDGKSYAGGKGGYTSGEIRLTKDEKLYFYIGGGNRAAGPGTTSGNASAYNGGGRASQQQPQGAGGGATDVRTVKATTAEPSDDVKSLASRVMVAAGGGGAVSRYNAAEPDSTKPAEGGPAGGVTGGDGKQAGSDSKVGKGGTQTAGGAGGDTTMGSLAGSFGKGANVTATSAASESIGAGGGGWFGGGSGCWAGSNSSGGGGSSYISGYNGCTGTSSNAGFTAQTASGVDKSKSWTGKVFTNPVIKSGAESMPLPAGGTETGHAGAGAARVTYIGP